MYFQIYVEKACGGRTVQAIQQRTILVISFYFLVLPAAP